MMYLPVIFRCVFGYINSSSIFFITIFSTITSCLVYIPQSMIPIQVMEVVPNFTLGLAVGLRELVSYLVGSSLGTILFGVIVDRWGWDTGFYAIMGDVVLCFMFCLLSRLGLLNIEKKKQKEETRLAKRSKLQDFFLTY